MDNIFINSENSKTSNPHRPLNLKKAKNKLFYQILAFNIRGKT